MSETCGYNWLTKRISLTMFNRHTNSSALQEYIIMRISDERRQRVNNTGDKEEPQEKFTSQTFEANYPYGAGPRGQLGGGSWPLCFI